MTCFPLRFTCTSTKIHFTFTFIGPNFSYVSPTKILTDKVSHHKISREWKACLLYSNPRDWARDYPQALFHWLAIFDIRKGSFVGLSNPTGKNYIFGHPEHQVRYLWFLLCNMEWWPYWFRKHNNFFKQVNTLERISLLIDVKKRC